MAAAKAQHNIAIPIVVLSIVVAALVQWAGLPGFAIVWLGVIIGGLAYQQPVIKASAKDDPEMLRKQRMYRLWRDWAIKSMWLPYGWKLPKFTRGDGTLRHYVSSIGNIMCSLLYSTVFIVVAGLLVGTIPLLDNEPVTDVLVTHLNLDTSIVGTLHVVNAVACILTCIGLAYAHRVNYDTKGAAPGTRLTNTITVAKSKPYLLIAPAVVGIVLAIITSPVMIEISLWPAAPTLLIVMITGVFAGSFPASRYQAMSHWKRVVEARHDWDERFKSIKINPPPHLEDISEHGTADNPITTYQFQSNPSIGGSAGILKKTQDIAATVGGSASVAVVPVEKADSSGQPLPGTVDALRFDIIAVENPDDIPSIADPTVNDDTITTLLRLLFAWASDEAAMRIMPLEHQSITTDDSSTNIFDVGFIGAHPTQIAELLAPTAASLGVSALGDHRANGGAGALYLGNFDDATYDPASALNDEKVEQLLGEQWWNQRFTEALKQGENPPRPEWATQQTQLMAEGTEIESLSFIMRQGHTLEKNFFPFEAEIANALAEYKFVSVVGFHDPSASRPAERHRQALTIRKSLAPVPSSMEDIRPAPGSKAPEWVLAGMINNGFADAKLARPELISARAMSSQQSATHLWQLRIRLYGGVTLADIRRKASQLRSVWSVEYLRVREDAEGVQLIAGSHPDHVELTTKATKTIDAMEWEQIFTDAGIKSESGVMPKLLSSSVVESNDKIAVKTFSLQGTGLSLDAFTSRRNKLESISANFFVQPQAAASRNPAEIELVVSETDPMPFPAPVDYDEIDQADDTFPFATGLYGETMCWSPQSDPHVLYSGLTGSGKSIVIQNIIYAALVQGMHVYILDPTKGGADFAFAQDYAAAMTGDVYEAAAIMRHVYAEVGHRKQLVAEHGVEKLANLPDEVRPPRVLLVLDEFTSLMEQEKPQPKSDNPEAEMAREQLLRLNAQKQVIGELTGRIAREARSVEITMLLGTQRLSSKVLDNIPGASDLKTNLARSILGQTTLADRQVALRNPYDAPSLGEGVTPGRGLWEPVTASRASIIQSWFEPDGQPALQQQLHERIEPWSKNQRPQWQQHIYRPETLTEARRIDAQEQQPMERDLGEMDLSIDF